MKSFVIKKIDSILELDEPLTQIEGFKYIPKVKNKLKVNQMIVVNPEIIYSLVDFSFNKKYKKILELYLLILQNEENSTSDGNLMEILNETARLRSILIRKYQKFLSKQATEKFLKKLKIIENEVRAKIIDYNIMHKIELEEEKTKGKGR